MSRSNLVEALGLLAVLAGLVFVGMEIRQNNRLAQAAAYQTIGVATSQNWALIAESSELSRLNNEANDSVAIATWDAGEWSQYYGLMVSWSRLAETTLLQVEQDLLPPGAMEQLGYASATTWLENPAVRCIWGRITFSAGETFRHFVENGRSEAQMACPIELPADVMWDQRR